MRPRNLIEAASTGPAACTTLAWYGLRLRPMRTSIRLDARTLGLIGRLALRPDARGDEPGHRGDRRRQARPALAPGSARGARVPVTAKQRSSSLLGAS